MGVEAPKTLRNLILDAIKVNAHISVDVTAQNRQDAMDLIATAADCTGRQWEEIEETGNGMGNWYSLINGRSDRFAVNVFVDPDAEKPEEK